MDSINPTYLVKPLRQDRDGLWLSKILKNLRKIDQLLFLAMVRPIGSTKRMEDKTTSAMRTARAQGFTKGNKCAKIKFEGPEMESKSVQEGGQEFIDSVDPSHRLSLQNLVQAYRGLFP